MYEVCAHTNDVEVLTVQLNSDFSLPVEQVVGIVAHRVECEINVDLLTE